MKKCTKCKIEKNLDQFSFRSFEKKTLCSECKQCVCGRSKEHYQKNKKKYNERRIKYYHENKDQELEKCKKYYQSNHERIRKRANELAKNPERLQKAREYSKKWLQNNREKSRKNALNQNKKNPKQYEARRAIYFGIKYGFINKPKFCEICKMEKEIQAHHIDYEKPLDVKWLCKLCHFHQHGKLLDIKCEGIL